jgi:hypothetical protein
MRGGRAGCPVSALGPGPDGLEAGARARHTGQCLEVAHDPAAEWSDVPHEDLHVLLPRMPAPVAERRLRARVAHPEGFRHR